MGPKTVDGRELGSCLESFVFLDLAAPPRTYTRYSEANSVWGAGAAAAAVKMHRPSVWFVMS